MTDGILMLQLIVRSARHFKTMSFSRFKINRRREAIKLYH